MKFVIIVRVDRGMTTDLSGKFYWEVRELLKKSDDSVDSDLLERSGPALAGGVAVDNATARSAAEEAARLLASEAIYVYDTSKV